MKLRIKSIKHFHVTEETIKMMLSVLAYCGPIALILYFTEKKDASVRFHVKQGVVVFSIEILVWLLRFVFWPLSVFLTIVYINLIIISIIGMINAIEGEEQELVLFGSLARYIP